MGANNRLGSLLRVQQLFGKLDPLRLPAVATDVIFGGNHFSGGLSPTNLPRRIEIFSVFKNSLSGSLELVGLAASLRALSF